MSEIQIGKVVQSNSHITCTCQVYAEREILENPSPVRYEFGTFVKIIQSNTESTALNGQYKQSFIIGVIFNTLVANQTFGIQGPRLSTQEQVEVFSPDFVSEKATLVSLILLGTMTEDSGRYIVKQGIPAQSIMPGSEVFVVSDKEIQQFHMFHDEKIQSTQQETLHLEYIPYIYSQKDSLLPMVVLNILEKLQMCFPEEASKIVLIRKTFEWRFKIETTS